MLQALLCLTLGADTTELARLEQRLIGLRRGAAIRRRVYTAKEAARNAVTQDFGTLSWVAGRAIGNAEGVTLGHVTIEPGKSNPRHAHPSCEEVLYLLKGTLLQTWGDKEVILHPGDTFWVDRGVFHNATNIGKETAELIVTYDSASRDIVHESDYKKDPKKFPAIRPPVAVTAAGSP